MVKKKTHRRGEHHWGCQSQTTCISTLKTKTSDTVLRDLSCCVAACWLVSDEIGLLQEALISATCRWSWTPDLNYSKTITIVQLTCTCKYTTWLYDCHVDQPHKPIKTTYTFLELALKYLSKCSRVRKILFFYHTFICIQRNNALDFSLSASHDRIMAGKSKREQSVVYQGQLLPATAE